MTISKRTAKIMLIGALATAALIYTVFGNSLSETEMVQLSYIWLPTALTGVAILITGANTLKIALTWFFSTIAGLFLFFEIIFPML